MIFPSFAKAKYISATEFSRLIKEHQNLITTQDTFKNSLKIKFNQEVNIRLFNSYKTPTLYPFEYSFNELSKLFYCREVVFYAGNQNVAFARSVLSIPKVLGKFEKKIMAMRDESMGPYLYSLNFNRTEFKPLKIKHQDKQYLGRNSIFYAKFSQLMISEVWFKD